MGEYDTRFDFYGWEPRRREEEERPSYAREVEERWRRFLIRARRWNAAHPKLVDEFNKLTGGECVTRSGHLSPKLVRAWQKRHGISGDGMVREQTIAVARAQKRSSSAPKPEDHARETPHATIRPEPAEPGGGFADELIATIGVTINEERREKEKPEEAKEEGGDSLSEAAEFTAEGAGIEEKLEHVKGGAVGLKVATQLARLPHLIHLLKEERYEEAVHYIRKGLRYSDYLKVIKLAAQHAGLDQVKIIPKIIRGVTIAVPAADAFQLIIEFQYEALKALQKAHEDGERDNQIFLYAKAWAHTLLYGGNYSNPGAIDDKQIEAVRNGVRDARATLAIYGEKAGQIGKQLLEHYGDPINAERALIDALIKRAGIKGIKFHEGK